MGCPLEARNADVSIGLCYWVLMLLWLVFGFWTAWPTPQPRLIAGNLMLFILMLLLGWRVFGPPLHG